MDSQRIRESNKVLNCLGMDFGFSVKKQVRISMKHYVDKVIKEFLDAPRKKIIPTPTTLHLFDFRSTTPRLKLGKKKKIRRILAQVLYILKMNKTRFGTRSAISH